MQAQSNSRAIRWVASLSLSVIAILTAGSGVRAQLGSETSTSFQSEHFEPAANQGLNILSVSTSRLLPHLMPSAGLVIHYAKDPLVLYQQLPAGQQVVAPGGRLIEHQVMGELWLSIGLADWLNVNLNVPVTLHMGGAEDMGSFGKSGGTLPSAAMGDLRLSAKLRFVNPAWTDGFGMALVAEMWAPTGDTDAWRGDGDARFAPKLVMDYRTEGGFGVALNVGYQLRPKRVSQNIVSDDVIRWAVGIEIPTVDEMQILLTGFGNIQLDDDIEPYSGSSSESRGNTPIDVVAAFQFKLPHELVLQVGGGLGLMRAPGSPEARALVSFGYTPDPVDSDGDGLRDAEDACPQVAEDMDGYQDEDGCPEKDNDGDGVLDTSDKCPLVKEDADGFEDDDGCPDPDNDKDGLADDKDGCPNEPEDFDNFEDTDGCPEPDNDKDGVADLIDKCPLVKEDADGFEDSDGCPDLDNDKDGIVDVRDKCPNKPETRNGFQDLDGCPDLKPKPKPKPTKVKVTKTRIEILEKVFFDSGKATIKPRSFALLREVAQVMNDHPAITKIRVEGHTDSRGKAGYNRRLSQARSESVRDFLVHAGVAAARLEAKGWGEDKPIASNKRKAGRAKNRRVEFVIVEVEGKPVGPGPVMVPK